MAIEEESRGFALVRRQADAAEQVEASGQKTRSGPANKGKSNATSGPSQTGAKDAEISLRNENRRYLRLCRTMRVRNHSPHMPPAGTLARTKRLIMAALRVWELKQGIRE